jgi:hypothetical protein
MGVCFRELNEDIIRINQKLVVNNFVPDGLKDMIMKYVPEDNYILGVKYTSGESQICISGHPKVGESIDEGCGRELTEELLLKCKKTTNCLFNVGVNYFYAIPLHDTYIYKFNEYKKTPDLEERAIVCIYGTEDEVFRYMRKIRRQDKNKDCINGIWAARKDKVLKVISIMRYTRKRAFIY